MRRGGASSNLALRNETATVDFVTEWRIWVVWLDSEDQVVEKPWSKMEEASNDHMVKMFKSQDPPCTLNWGYMVPNSRYLGPNRGQEEGLGLKADP